MELFIKVIAGTLIALVLYLILGRLGKEFSLLLSIGTCCMIAALSVTFIQPVMTFIDKLVALGKLDTDMLKIVLKSVGIGFLSEIAGLICADAGNAALGKVLQILTSAVILWLSLPLFSSLIALVEEILAAI